VNSQVYSRYRCVYTLVEFAAAVAFVIGSVCFFSEDLTLQAELAVPHRLDPLRRPPHRRGDPRGPSRPDPARRN
jgi:hypothetical protein